jgi:hypothetical protein
MRPEPHSSSTLNVTASVMTKRGSLVTNASPPDAPTRKSRTIVKAVAPVTCWRVMG